MKATTIGILVLGLILVFGLPFIPKHVPAETPTTARVAGPIQSPGVNLRRTPTVEVIERTKDAVVYISSAKLITMIQYHPIFQQVPIGTAPAVRNSLGSGFIIHPDGYIVTNNHVVDRAREIKVTLLDGRQFDAELVSSDADADLAVLRIHANKPLPALELGDTSDLMIGEPVIAVGNPLGLSHTVSTGIVSAIHRELKTAENTTLADMIQTDAAINPGNSGGPLLNAYGQVIGINTAIGRDAQNIGFAIQINRLRDLLPDLMDPSQVTKVDVGMKLKETRHLTPPSNVESVITLADGPASPVVSINNKRPKDLVDAYATLLQVKQDERLTVQFAADSSKTFKAKAVPLPDAVAKAKDKLGIIVEQVTPMLSGQRHLPPELESGIFVDEVAADSVAGRAGIQPGDVILQVGRLRVNKLEELGYILQSFENLPKDSVVPVFILRGQEVRGIRLSL